MKHILMVDDITTNLKFAAEVLKDTYKLSMAKSGKQALKFLEKVQPDLILLDVLMPEMNGYETYEKIKENPEIATIPVIFLTADLDDENEIRGLRMGAMDYIKKPFEPEVMRSRIEKVLRIEEKHRDLIIRAKKDVLTNLWNRKYLEEELYRFMLEEDNKGAFLVMDMDNFKKINDNYGHIMGDALLINFAESLWNITSKEDIICRIGGDEFVVFLKGDKELEEVVNFTNTVNDSLQQNVILLTGEKCDVSVSIGISLFPEDGEDFTQLYHKADKALYFVKQNGKKGHHFYQEKEHYAYSNNMMDKSVDIDNLKKQVEENQYRTGAYQVEYSGFKNIYQFISRCIDRTKQKVQVVVFFLEGKDEYLNISSILNEGMEQLKDAIVSSLRRGDVSTRFGSNQFVIILMDTDKKNGEMVANRVMQQWSQLITNKELTLRYEIEEIYREKKANSKNSEN